MDNDTTPRAEELTMAPSELPCELQFSAKDLALCSTEEARHLLQYERAVSLCVLPMALVRRRAIEERPPSHIDRVQPKLHCAVVDDSHESLRALQFAVGCEVLAERVPRELLEEAIPQAYLGCEARLKFRLERIRSAHGVASDNGQPDESKYLAGRIPQAVGDIANFVNELIEFGFARGASDLHLCPTPQGALIKMRIDGDILSQNTTPYPRSAHDQMLSRIKVLSGLDIACRKLPQDGAFSIKIASGVRSIRVSTLPTLHGESVVLRFMHTHQIPSIAMLGLEPLLARIIRESIARSHGVIVLTGPTGSGKTTTMYSILMDLLGRSRNIVTVEDPVEVPISGIVQVQVDEQQGLDYPRAIRSVLRHDPDVILIGEIRDGVSAKIAMESGTTGHLTLSSLHIASALDVIERFKILGVSATHASGALSLVVNQRLLPKLCEGCREVDAVNSRHFGCSVYQASGCSRCAGAGFSGRVLITEALDLRSVHAKELCSRAGSIGELIEGLSSEHFIPWTTSLQFQLVQGTISAAQFQRFIDSEIHAV